jgi:hypothetical protein
LIEQINIDLDKANEELIEGSGPYLEGALLAGGEDALALLEIEISFDIYSAEAIDFIFGKQKVMQDINRITWEQIKKELAEGFEAGETMKDMAARIRKVFKHADEVRSLRIAQTEINSAANFGTLEGYRQSGVVDAKEWLAGSDARPTHQEAEARYTGDGAIPLGEDFHVGAGWGPAPGSIGLAEEDIN